MDIHQLNSLRLGFSTNEAQVIENKGVKTYIAEQLSTKLDLKEPACLAKQPRTIKEFQQLKKKQKQEKNLIENQKVIVELKSFFLEKCYETKYPLRMKINLFWSNHFVSTFQTVKFPLWIYQHFETIHLNAIGNYKTLVKEMLHTNALIKYLDNQQNKKGAINENLGRELLELFTLGEGHYTESDIKNAALSLAGLNFGEQKAVYYPKMKDNSTKTFMGKTGNFDADAIVDIIFENKQTAYFLAEKLLKWFFYDNPSQEIVKKYGDVLLKHNYELKPFYQELFETECQNDKGGNQLKNPLIFTIQLLKDLSISKPNYPFLAFFTKSQGMDVYDQVNVKGWKGGRDWLTAQTYIERKKFVDFVLNGNKQFQKSINKKLQKFDLGTVSFQPNLILEHRENAKSILIELKERMIFQSNPTMDADLNQLLKYDFDPKGEFADKSILRVYQFLADSPEFQII